MVNISIFASFSGQGGVESSLANLANGFARQDIPVDLVLIRDDSEHLQRIDEHVNVISLPTNHSKRAVRPFADYLEKRRPKTVIASKHRAILTALKSREKAKTSPRVVGQIQTMLSKTIERKNPLIRWKWNKSLTRNYAELDHLVGNSEGVCEDLHSLTTLSHNRISKIENPVVAPELQEWAKQPIDHPWFKTRECPVLLTAGRLAYQKDFHTLLRAFHLARKVRPLKLIVLGEGKEYASLQTLAKTLGISAHVDFPGFAKNPYPWMRETDLFVLSSRWEGNPVVLAEALALGTPVVSTNCPSGPSEILDKGTLAPLVPVEAPDKLARAILKSLQNPPNRESLQKATSPYLEKNSISKYLQILN